MLELPQTEQSYWQVDANNTDYAPIKKDVTVDVVIVGGGIAGMTAAYVLKRAGLRVAILEKNRVGSGTTGGTTGKVTTQHGLLYADLLQNYGRQIAQTYATANQAAFTAIEHVIINEKIACNWSIEDSYVYTTDSGQVARYKTEAETAKSLGLSASFETELGLPFPVTAAVKFSRQARFNARSYVQGLAELVHGQGSYVFEHSNVIGFKDGVPARVRTSAAVIRAKDIVVASKVPAFPLIARFGYAALEYPHTSYIVAAEHDGKLSGMYISPDKNHYSILPIQNGTKHLLLIGGENHIPGLGSPLSRYRKLAEYAQKHFGVTSIAYMWRAMDYLAYDKLPLIGKLYPWSKHMYVATGFKKWGLTTSMVAALILRDAILKRPNPWAKAFDSTRLSPIRSIPKTLLKQ